MKKREILLMHNCTVRFEFYRHNYITTAVDCQQLIITHGMLISCHLIKMMKTRQVRDEKYDLNPAVTSVLKKHELSHHLQINPALCRIMFLTSTG